MLDSMGQIPFSAFCIHCEFAPHPRCEWNYRLVQFGGYEKRHHMVVSCMVASDAIVHGPCSVPFLKSTLFPTEGCRKPSSIRLLSPSLAELQVHRVFSPDSPLLVAHKPIGQGGNVLSVYLALGTDKAKTAFAEVPWTPLLLSFWLRSNQGA